MSMVIDSLVLELGLDASKFTAGQRDAIDSLRRMEERAKSSGTQVEAQSKKILDLLSSVRREAIGAITGILGGRGIGEFVGYITNLNAQTGRLAYTMDVSAGTLRAWQGAISQAGGSAQSANSALGGLSSEMSRFTLTGQSSMLPVLSRLGVGLYDQNHNLKTTTALWLDLADAVQGMDPGQASAFLGMIPGANADMINFALTGRKAMEGFIASAARARDLTGQDVEAAKEYQKQLSLLKDSADGLGQSIVTLFGPAASRIMGAMGRLFSAMGTGSVFGAGDRALGIDNSDAGIRYDRGNGRFELKNLPSRHVDMLGGAEETDAQYAARAEEMRQAAVSRAFGAFAPATGAKAGSSAVADFIRAEAIKRGMDPDQAVRVLTAESGLDIGAVGDSGTSFGVGQLHYGGGLGDTFTKQTGLNARDPSTWKQQVPFILDNALSGGWGPWHAWKGQPWAGIPHGGSGAGAGKQVNVGGVTIYDSSGNSREIADSIDKHLQRSLTAGAANGGAQ